MKLSRLLLIPLLIAACSWPVQAQLYFESFTSTSSTPNEVGWKSYTGSTAQDLSDDASGNDGGTWSSAGSDATGSYIFEGNSWTDQANLIYANNLPTGGSAIDVADVDEITFHSRGDSAAGDFYLAVEVGGSWYRTTTGYNGTVWTEHTLDFSTGTGNWYEMDFTAGGTTDLGGGDFGGTLDFSGTTNPTSALSGTLNHIGFAIDTTATAANNQRFDEITITAVPEPSSTLLLLLGVLGLVCNRRRS